MYVKNHKILYLRYMFPLTSSDKKSIETIINNKFDVLDEKIDNIVINELYESFEKIQISPGNINDTRKGIYPLPPYNFIYFISKQLKSTTIEDFKKSMSYKNAKISINIIENLNNLIDENVNNNLRIIELDKNIIPLILNTDNKIFYRHLFFKTIFINNQFEFEDMTIKGILVNDIENNYFITLPIIHNKTMEITLEFFYLISKRKDKLLEYIKEIVLNIVDLVEANDEDLDTIIIETTKEQNIKKINKGNIPYPTKVYIRPKENFKKYINEFAKDTEEEKRKIGHKFLVRGHWRILKDERYSTKSRETPLWIKPFYKGHGILVKKEYKIME